MLLFTFGSLINIAIIALERVHATFCPFKHRVLTKWVYRLIIAVVWVTSGLVTIAYMLLTQLNKLYYGRYFYLTYLAVCLLIICASYTSIVIKVRCGAQPQCHGATSKKTDHDIVDCDCCISSGVPAVRYSILCSFKIQCH